MIKGIKGYKNSEWLVELKYKFINKIYLLNYRLRVPIIENTERECVLTERLKSAIIAYPRS